MWLGARHQTLDSCLLPPLSTEPSAGEEGPSHGRLSWPGPCPGLRGASEVKSKSHPCHWASTGAGLIFILSPLHLKAWSSDGVGG